MTTLFEGDTDLAEGMATVGRFESPMEAQLAKGMLESAGIECQLVGENANVLMQGIFGVRLQVLEHDAVEARELMAGAAGDKELDGNVEV
jgi:Putative prokaryotic signal transducing protein